MNLTRTSKTDIVMRARGQMLGCRIASDDFIFLNLSIFVWQVSPGGWFKWDFVVVAVFIVAAVAF